MSFSLPQYNRSSPRGSGSGANEIVTPPDTKQTPEEIERHWFENVYAGDRMPQLTPRALIMGMMLGAVMSLSNVYVGLKAGWGLGVAITSSILAFAAFSTMHKLFPKQFPEFSILENNAMASCASAAGYMTGAGLVNAIPALMMLKPDAFDAKTYRKPGRVSPRWFDTSTVKVSFGVSVA